MKKAEIKISDKLYVSNLDKEVRKVVQSALTFVNPAYDNADKHGLYIAPDLDPKIKYFKYSRKVFQMPKGGLSFLINMIDKYSEQKYKIINETVQPKIKSLTFKGKLRSYQKTAVKKLIPHDFGVLQASTGSGKTVMGIKMIVERQTRTLIVVHNKELLYQWQDRIKSFLNYECGLIGDGHENIKDVTVGIINSVKTRVKKLKKEFGFVILDECHRCPATSWTDAIGKFHAKYQLGLSATPYRKDGLGNAIYAFIGPLQHAVSKKRLINSGAVLKPTIKTVNTRFFFQYRNNYSTMIKKLTEDKERNVLIVSKILSDFKERKSPILVVSDRVSHCKELQRALEAKGLRTALLHSGIKKDVRKDVVQLVRDGKAEVLISTLQLIGEGFDAPGLYSLFLTTPVKFEGRLIQIIGRILRPEKGKEAIVYDFRDDDTKVLRYSGFARSRIYKSEWG